MGDEWLDGWKAIAAVIKVCPRTAQRYHAAGMPVSCPPGMNVKALKCEIVAWWEEYVERGKRKGPGGPGRQQVD